MSPNALQIDNSHLIDSSHISEAIKQLRVQVTCVLGKITLCNGTHGRLKRHGHGAVCFQVTGGVIWHEENTKYGHTLLTA